MENRNENCGFFIYFWGKRITMSFKLLAIRPLKGCNPKFLKNLEEGRIYKFYNDYEFFNGEDRIDDFNYKIDINSIKDVERIEVEETLPKDFFGESISVSAIVGKNGNGKSALIELFIVTINNLAQSYGFQTNYDGYEDVNYLKHVAEIHVEFYFEIDNLIYKIKMSDKKDIKIDFFDVLNKKFNSYNCNFEIFIKNNLFYSAIINYSLWAYNSLEIGDFINALFHKNDAYQVPLVLNPFRQQGGIISPESEKELARDRLLYNVFQPTENATKITENLDLVKICLELKKGNYDEYSMFREKKNGNIRIIKFKEFKENIESKNQKKILLKYLFEFYDLNFEDYYNDSDWGSTIEYIIYKTVKIVTRYEEYQKFIDIDSKYFYEEKIDDFLSEFSNDKTHITLKIRQIFNFIKFHNILGIDLKSNDIDVIDYSKKVNELNEKYKIDIIDALPPSIFSIKLLLTNNIEFDHLSSGEKQMISTVSSILYHLNNLFSVREKQNKIKYKNFNLILEEIELYFHPEYQRIFVKRILDGIRGLKLSKVNINILFVTHSPFILSDIPRQNILFLKVDKEVKISQPNIYNNDNTFAENIHEMLTDGFFITSTKGEFAISKINDFLDFYEKCSSININSKGYEIYKKEYNSNNFPLLISLIGEQYIRRILENHLEILEKLFETDSYKEKRILDLKAEIEKLEKK